MPSLAAFRQQVVIDAATCKVVEHLVGLHRAAAGTEEFLHVVHVEVADAPSGSCPALQRLEGREGLGKRHVAAPVQQIEIDMVGAEPPQTCSQARIVPERDAFWGRTLLTRNTSSRRPAIASPPLPRHRPPHTSRRYRSASCRDRCQPERRDLFGAAPAILAHLPGALARTGTLAPLGNTVVRTEEDMDVPFTEFGQCA